MCTPLAILFLRTTNIHWIYCRFKLKKRFVLRFPSSRGPKTQSPIATNTFMFDWSVLLFTIKFFSLLTGKKDTAKQSNNAFFGTKPAFVISISQHASGKVFTTENNVCDAFDRASVSGRYTADYFVFLRLWDKNDLMKIVTNLTGTCWFILYYALPFMWLNLCRRGQHFSITNADVYSF